MNTFLPNLSLSGKNVTLAIDGWSNLVNYPVLGILCDGHLGLFTNNCEQLYPKLMDAIDTTGQPHTADYLTDVMVASMKKTREELNATVVGIVTDNANNMANMRDQVADTLVFTYGCQAHILNLLAKDLLRDNGRSTVSKQVVGILTHTFGWGKNPTKCNCEAP